MKYCLPCKLAQSQGQDCSFSLSLKHVSMPRNNVFFQLYNMMSTNNRNNNIGNSFIHLRFRESGGVLSRLQTGGVGNCRTPDNRWRGLIKNPDQIWIKILGDIVFSGPKTVPKQKMYELNSRPTMGIPRVPCAKSGPILALAVGLQVPAFRVFLAYVASPLIAPTLIQ